MYNVYIYIYIYIIKVKFSKEKKKKRKIKEKERKYAPPRKKKTLVITKKFAVSYQSFVTFGDKIYFRMKIRSVFFSFFFSFPFLFPFFSFSFLFIVFRITISN